MGSAVEINKYGKYSLSTMANSRAANWSPSKKRFIDENRHKKDIPGPGVYNPSDYSGSMGYILSNNKNLGSVTMKKKIYKRLTTESKQTPGPGTYISPSDFGHLEMYRSSPRISSRRGS
jgi:hypothetical protein